MTQTIDRQSPVPYWEQLFGILRDDIVSGRYPAEERLPSELELGRQFALSRATIRQTLSNLEAEGFAKRVPRRGVFASLPTEPSGWTVEQGFLESQIHHGRTGIETKVVDAAFVVPAQHVAEALGIDAGAKVFALQRVRSLDGRVTMFSTNWFPEEPARVMSTAPQVLDGSGSVNETLAAAGFTVHGGHRVLRAMRAPENVAKHLGVTSNDPVLRVRSSSWAQGDKRFDYYETWVLTDIVPLEVHISAS